MSRERKCIIEFDGASSGNPGKSGAGAVIRDGNQVQRFSQGLGTKTNNAAEYGGLILGLKEANKQGYNHVELRGDSQLVCKQFEGAWKVKSPNLAGYHSEASQLKDNFKSVTIQHVPRGYNADADAAANRGKNLGAGQVEEGTLNETAVPPLVKALEETESVKNLKVNLFEGLATLELEKQTTIKATRVASNLVETIRGLGFKLQTLNLSFEDEEVAVV